MDDACGVHKVQQLYITDFLHVIPGVNDTAACGLVIEFFKLPDVDRKIGIIGSSGFSQWNAGDRGEGLERNH